MNRPDDEQAPQDGTGQATAPPKCVQQQQAGLRDAAPRRPDLWCRTVDLWFRTVARDQEFRCPVCGYDLRGLLAPAGFFRCPECGTVASRCNAMVKKDATTWWGRWRYHLLVITLLAALLVLVVPLVPDDFTYEVIASFVILVILTYLALRVPDTNRQVSRQLPGLGAREHATAGMDRALSEVLPTSQDEPGQSADEAPGLDAAPELSLSAARESAKRGLAAVIFVLGCFVALAVLETRGGPLVPALKPLFGVPFGVAFLAAQLGYVLTFRIKRGWLWILGFCILRIPFFFLTSNTALWRNPEALSGVTELVTSTACFSGFLLGLLVLAHRL